MYQILHLVAVHLSYTLYHCFFFLAETNYLIIIIEAGILYTHSYTYENIFCMLNCKYRLKYRLSHLIF